MTLQNCLGCSKPVRRSRAKYCSRPCSDSARRAGSNTESKGPYRRLVGHIGHPLASKQTGVILEHRKVLFDHIGPGDHPCHWCKALVTWQHKAYSRAGNLVVDHLDGNRFNNSLDNLVPSCSPCNTGRGSEAIRFPEVFLTRKDGRRERAEQRICKSCGKDFLIELTAIRSARSNVGQFCSRRCNLDSARKLVPVALQEGDKFVVMANGDRHRARELTCAHCSRSFLFSIAELKKAVKQGRTAGKFCSRKCYHSQRSIDARL